MMKSVLGRSTSLLLKGALAGTGGFFFGVSPFLTDLATASASRPLTRWSFFFRKHSGEFKGTFAGPIVLHGWAPARYSLAACGLENSIYFKELLLIKFCYTHVLQIMSYTLLMRKLTFNKIVSSIWYI